MTEAVTVIGAGLAGSEAAWQLAKRGVKVRLIEMRPAKFTPAHHTDKFAELVCSNSLRAAALENAVGLLKEEMRRLDSLIMRAAEATRVPAGGALAVDRDRFSDFITSALTEHPAVSVERREVTEIPAQGIVIIATGPLTSDAMAARLGELTGTEHLYFYDAVAPIVTLESVNLERCFWGSRYGKGEKAYLNCPLTQEEYERFWEELVRAERHPLKEFEELKVFEGCMPVEEMARRGPETLRFGPLKPVGLVDPHTGRQPYAVVQLRQDNREGTLYNLVGFQTQLKWGEQKRVFGLIPGLENAEFVRYGVMHRNTFIASPKVLAPTWQLKAAPRLFVAGQVTGVEGYVESAASGLVAGINAARLARGLDPIVLSPETACGALAHYVTTAGLGNFQPMNVNFGLFPPLGTRVRGRRERNLALAQRALAWFDNNWKHFEL
ncbi:methylenetetrahydrofolate--tRNA-(uracil(54)-C(5))-methyltransferase (FADH(2)-oxidizing) TrmFO [Gelria sp. Kuro-4]|uniref:methylenetetrahydrofolate--tRNA-(uracil(54)- C(5))-methyltransferase (FADH(2)-oxidizing) TrmFO n=1 Tax=Gelria sp. Kuro-4 TaxID=2796927 RepID=UPI001BEF8C78|nr:methylenetetrahydrofolate--tRNA-(uracil(54)-C(5))-methyltransferase (FADH(2)-oxidizing) TrmFO [Gelria sp. Kuro-4]BCV24912.1 methylenetetrahydrofolate--tRNA-(uracil-5-)-methyltransferase TrmFO [Gelria sp. Kuro-4]